MTGRAIFDGCKSLKGCRGTAYDANNTGLDFFRIDGGANDPGYLSIAGTYLNYLKIRNSYDDFNYPRNDSYHIPLSRYKAVFGRRGSFVFNMFDDAWGGSCYGFSSTSGLFYVPDNGVKTSSYPGYGTGLTDFLINDGKHPPGHRLI